MGMLRTMVKKIDWFATTTHFARIPQATIDLDCLPAAAAAANLGGARAACNVILGRHTMCHNHDVGARGGRCNRVASPPPFFLFSKQRQWRQLPAAAGPWCSRLLLQLLCSVYHLYSRIGWCVPGTLPTGGGGGTCHTMHAGDLPQRQLRAD